LLEIFIGNKYKIDDIFFYIMYNNIKDQLENPVCALWGMYGVFSF